VSTSAPPRSDPAQGATGAATVAGRAEAPGLRVPRPTWLTGYTGLLVVLDATAMGAATLTAKISWLGINPESFHIRSVSIPYGALALLTVPTWVVLLALAGAYDLGPFATSARSWIQVVRAGAQLLAVIAVSYYVLHLEMLGRGVLVGLVPLAVALTLGARAMARLGLDQLRRRGRARRTAVVVGTQPGVDGFVKQVDARPTSGVAVVGLSILGNETAGVDASTPTNGNRAEPSNGAGTVSPGGSGTEAPTAAPAGRPAIAVGDRWRQLAAALARMEAESVIITGGLAQGQLRDVAWMLEGTGVALLVTTAPADLQELPSVMRPVAGLPLLYLDR
jgi:CoA-binding domain